MIRSSSELSLGHILQISYLNNGVNTTGLEMQELNPTLQNLDPPPQKLLQLLLVAEHLIVHFSILEDTIRIVTDGVAAAVESVHIGDGALQLLEPQILLQDGVGGELLPPTQALEEHVEGVLDLEIPSAEEFEENDVGPLVGVAQERDAPHGVRAVGGHELVLEVLEGLALGVFEVGDEVGVFFEGRGTEFLQWL